MSNMKKDKLMKKLEHHLRSTARHLIKFDTEEEVLQYLTTSFRTDIYCDFVGVILNEKDKFVLKAWSGTLPSVTESFPLPVELCSPKLLKLSLTHKNADSPDCCQLSKILKAAQVKTWFSVPLYDYEFQLGFCIVGFLNDVPLLDMETTFDEFGKDIAAAMGLARQKNSQLKKFETMEWINKTLSLNAPLEHQIAELTLWAGKGTNADFACIYLYNEKENCFVFQPPSYGKMELPYRITIEEDYELSKYFPFLEKTGGNQLSFPLVSELRTIGVLYVGNKREAVFTENDLKMLELLSNHVAAVLENARLFNNEKEQKNRLQYLLDYQQALVKQTIEADTFEGITAMLSDLFQNQVILFDRFLRPISVGIETSQSLETLLELVAKIPERERENSKSPDFFSIEDPDSLEVYTFWKINGGGSLLGYLTIRSPRTELDEIERLTIELARNICSIQFIKQKISLDAKEQAKDSFISKLLAETIEDKEGILRYANLFQWDLYKSHQLAVLSITLADKELRGSNLFEQQAKKNLVWDYIKSSLSSFEQTILTGYHDEKHVLIVPTQMKSKRSEKFWQTLYHKIRQWVSETFVQCEVYMGVGGKTTEMHDYYVSYQQAIQALNIVNSRLRQKGFSSFEELGSYTILHHLNHSMAVDLFVKKQLGPLLNYSEGKNTDLYNTLHTFLQHNGNVKSTAEALFIHRSSLLYRLEKIEALLAVDLSDAEVRFNLMMALKLFDMYGKEIERKSLLSLK